MKRNIDTGAITEFCSSEFEWDYCKTMKKYIGFCLIPDINWMSGVACHFNIVSEITNIKLEFYIKSSLAEYATCKKENDIIISLT